MDIKKIIIEKINMLKNNPRAVFYWAYKLSNLLKQNTLNNGERYDPNILNKFNIDDRDQIERYRFAKNLISKNESVLDIACGTGYGTFLLSDSCLNITGVDISERAIKYATQHYSSGNNKFLQSNIFDYDEKADIVISFETIEHIEASIKDTVEKLLELCHRRLICSVPYLEKDGNNKFHRHFNIDENSFNFADAPLKMKFLYQTKDGQIKEEKNTNAETLILIIEK